MLFYTSISFDLLLIIFAYLLLDIVVRGGMNAKSWTGIIKYSVCYSVGMTLLSEYFATFIILKLPIIFIIQFLLYIIFMKKDIFNLGDNEENLSLNVICYHVLCFTLTFTVVIL